MGTVSENIILQAKNETKKALSEMEKDTRKAAGSLEKDLSKGAGSASKRVGELGKGLNNTVQQLTGFNIAQLGAAGAVALVAKGIGESIRFTAQYAEQVREVSAATGTSAEETSKLIQLFDDANVSQGSLTQAMRQMVRNGMQPSVESIALLADEYNAMQDPVARSQLLLDKFGKAGLEMGKMLEMGSDAIRDAGESAERMGQVLDDEAIAAAEEYRLALDDLSDAAEGVKIKIGKGLIPVLADAANAMNNWLESTAEHKDALSLLNKALTAGIITQEEYNAAIDVSAKGTQSLRISESELGEIEKEYQAIMQRGIDMGRIKAALYDTTATAADDVASATDRATAAEERAVSVYGAAEEALRNSNAPLALRQQIEEELALAAGKVTPQELAMRDAIQFATAAALSGKMPLSDYYGVLQKVKQGALDAEGALKATKTAMDSIKSKTVTFHVILKQTGQIPAGLPGSGPIPKPKPKNNVPVIPPGLPGSGGAHGLDMVVPPGYPGDSYPIWTTSGEHVKVTPQGKGAGGSVYIGNLNVYASEGMDEYDLAEAVALRIAAQARAASNAGLGFAG